MKKESEYKNNTEDTYQRVSCDFYDVLSNAAVLKQSVTINKNDKTSIEGLITDIYTKEKSEYVIISGEHIRLDKIDHLTYNNNNSEEE